MPKPPMSLTKEYTMQRREARRGNKGGTGMPSKARKMAKIQKAPKGY